MQIYSTLSILLIVSHRFTSGTQVILNESIGVTNVRSQRIYLFETEGCTGKSLTIADSSSFSGVQKLSAFVVGMWRVKISPIDAPEITEEFIVIPGTTTCKKFSTQEVADIQFIRYGPEDPSVPELSVFSEPNFAGTSHKISSEGAADIAVVSGKSYVSSGPLNWALYSEQNFTGDVTCIVPSKDIISNGYGVSYALYAKTPLVFKSAKAGACAGGGESITTTTANYETTTTSDPSEDDPTTATPPLPSGGPTIQGFASLALLVGISLLYLVK